MRAKSLKDAQSKIDAERARAPDAAPLSKEPLGGKPPRKTSTEILWRNPATNDPIKIRITHARDYLSLGRDHIEVQSIAPDKAPLPITGTGYRSHLLSPAELVQAGGAVPFVTSWLDQEAKAKNWTRAAQARAQGDLFDWAAARDEVGGRKDAKTKRPAATAQRAPRKTAARSKSPKPT